jgi:hypothetical protein
MLSATNKSKQYDIGIFVAKKGGESLPGPTGYGAGDWKSVGNFTLLDQKLEKKALIYQGNTENITYQSQNERTIIFPSTNTFFLFNLQAKNINGTYKITKSDQKEFEQFLSTFKFTQ